jgi:hypothetical protein
MKNFEEKIDKIYDRLYELYNYVKIHSQYFRHYDSLEESIELCDDLVKKIKKIKKLKVKIDKLYKE